MTVKEIFDLRKQGMIEEAYEAIRPMYAVHKGYYTSLCMYLTARDVFLLRIDQGCTAEARKIYEALKRLIPSIEDRSTQRDAHSGGASLKKEDQVSRFMEYAARRLEEAERAILSNVEESLNRGQQEVLDCIKAHEGINVPRISEETNIPSKSIERHVAVLIARNLIEHRGSKKTGGYHVL